MYEYCKRWKRTTYQTRYNRGSTADVAIRGVVPYTIGQRMYRYVIRLTRCYGEYDDNNSSMSFILSHGEEKDFFLLDHRHVYRSWWLIHRFYCYFYWNNNAYNGNLLFGLIHYFFVRQWQFDKIIIKNNGNICLSYKSNISEVKDISPRGEI